MFVVDIEGRGPSALHNGIVSIGVVVAQDGKILDKRRFDLLPLDGQSMDPKCKADFWDKNPDLLTILQKDAVKPSMGMLSFRQFLNEWEDKIPNLYLLSDCPGYDFHFISTYLEIFHLKPLTHTGDGHFRPLHDADSYARGRRHDGLTTQWVSNSELGLKVDTSDLVSHMPEDDAESIYRYHQALIDSK